MLFLKTPDSSKANSADPFIAVSAEPMPEMSKELVHEILQSQKNKLKRTSTTTTLDGHADKRAENEIQRPVSKPKGIR